VGRHDRSLKRVRRCCGCVSGQSWRASIHPDRRRKGAGMGTPAGAGGQRAGSGLCSGIPITEVLIEQRLAVYGVDASPSLVSAFRQRWPDTPVSCEPAEESPFFGLQFDAILAWGLMFLLPDAVQRELIRRIGGALKPQGCLLFTSPAEAVTWVDVMTGQASRSLGAAGKRCRGQFPCSAPRLLQGRGPHDQHGQQRNGNRVNVLRSRHADAERKPDARHG